jgi:hypothetical protein
MVSSSCPGVQRGSDREAALLIPPLLIVAHCMKLPLHALHDFGLSESEAVGRELLCVH